MQSRQTANQYPIREQGLKATKLHADDTPVSGLDPGRGKTATGVLMSPVKQMLSMGSSGAAPLGKTTRIKRRNTRCLLKGGWATIGRSHEPAIQAWLVPA